MDTECPICLEVITPLSDKVLLVSQVCDHKICDVCVEQQLASQVGLAQCAICRTQISRSTFVPYDMTASHYTNFKEARKRVLQIYNDTRRNFKNTPEYNAYMEQREDLIAEMANCKNEAKRKKLEMNLKNYERANAAKISENIAYQKEQLKQRVRSIVDVEKTFYEAVDKDTLFSVAKNSNHVHPLQRIYASFFTQLTPTFTSSECKPLNAAIKNDTDIVRRTFESKRDLWQSDVAGGYNSALVDEACMIQLEALLLWNL